MVKANMSPDSDKNDSSDDLINELARLMAADARGSDESKPADKPAGPAPVSQASWMRAGSAVAPERSANDTQPQAPVSASDQAPRFTPPSETPVRAEEPRMPASERLNTGHSSQSDINSWGERSEPAVQPRQDARKSDRLFENDILQGFSPFQTDDFKEDLGQPEPEPVVEPEMPQRTSTVAITAQAQPAAQVQTDLADAESDPLGDLIALQLGDAARAHPEEQAQPRPAPAPQARQSSVPELGDLAEMRDWSEKGQGFDAASAVPPVAKPEPDVAPKKRDPLDDIESLIGEAVRLGVTERAVTQRAAPAAKPNAEPHSDMESAVSAAEAAIMAAAGSVRQPTPATQPQARQIQQAPTPTEPAIETPRIERAKVDLQTGDDFAADGDKGAERFSRLSGFSWRRVGGPLVAAVLLVVAALGLYFVFGTGEPSDEAAPVLTATNEPVKAEPEATAEPETAESSVVFNEDAASEADAANEQLVSRDQSTTPAGDVSRVIEAEDDGGSEGLVNRKVRTVTVRPDGTIVSGDDALAGSEALPIERPNVPEIPAESQTADAGLADEPILPASTQTDAADGIAALTAGDDALTETVTDTSATAEIPPVPRPRPNRPETATAASTPATIPTTPSASTNDAAVDLIAGNANASVAPTSNSAPATTSSAAVATGASAPAYVQLSSQRSIQAAQQSLAEIQSLYGSALSGGSLEVQQVDLGDRGTFYRVRMPASSIESANQACAAVKSAGGDCFVRTD